MATCPCFQGSPCECRSASHQALTSLPWDVFGWDILESPGPWSRSTQIGQRAGSRDLACPHPATHLGGKQETEESPSYHPGGLREASSLQSCSLQPWDAWPGACPSVPRVSGCTEGTGFHSFHQPSRSSSFLSSGLTHCSASAVAILGASHSPHLPPNKGPWTLWAVGRKSRDWSHNPGLQKSPSFSSSRKWEY